MTAREYIRNNWNVPNALTLLRLLLVPVYVVLFATGRKYAALITFLVASFTDLLDGRIARRFNLITDFGKLMDPLADKIMVLTAMFSLAIGNAAIPAVIPWPAVIVLLGKELFMIWGSTKLFTKGMVVYSSMIGKVAHCAFIASLVSMFFHDWFEVKCAGWFQTPDLIMLWLSVVLTLCAMVFYTMHALRHAKQKGIISKTKKQSPCGTNDSAGALSISAAAWHACRSTRPRAR